MIDTASTLHLAVEATDEGLFTRIISSPAGEASAPFSLPVRANELSIFWDTLAGASDLSIADHVERQRETRSMGEQLYQSLLAESLSTAFQSSLRIAYQQQGPLRLRLSLPDDPRLQMLPWEYLFDPSRQEYLALSQHSPLMRYVRLRHQIRPFRVESPLRALVVIADADEEGTRNAGREWIKLIDTLDYLGIDRRLLVERLERPTLFELQQRLRRNPYHILHVVGRAYYNEASADGRLVMEDEVGHARPISGQHLGQMLRDHYATRLVILQSSNEEHDRRNPLGLIAQNLVPRGIPAAIVLPHKLPDVLLLAFLHDLYAAVADYQPIDLAMAEARAAMVSEATNVLWGTPWLVARTEDGYLFDDGNLPTKPEETGRRRQPSLLERVLGSNREGEW